MRLRYEPSSEPLHISAKCSVSVGLTRVVFTPNVGEFVPENSTLGRVGVEERCPPRKKSRVERLKAKVEPLLT